MLRRSLAALTLGLTLSSVAGAQDFGGFRRGGGEPGSFDFYVLALSWSPTYCDGEGARRDRDGQCAPGRGLGFVVHGLWPQYDRGFPSNCSAVERPLTRNAIDAAGEVMPSEGLARHEWRTHGTCSGLDPVAYFKAVKAARTAVTIPDALNKPDGTIRAAPIDIARQFVAANKGLRPDMMAVTCRRGQLQEVRICFSKDLRGFAPCPEVARQNCRAGEVTIEAAR
ncbi:ribonuclease T2 family protein [Methylorubrum salsuginis]|uniref:Ribonuclease T2 n=1 Tax=Methylorubrum salsuginis TaxID=414703 RepID=A0A1I3ZVY6_9HYPH|nr:ribonuclease T2 [Methylorubrum salsuginis]SFK48334.1 ribonuclease T2 [Methylorubrum salsuginis]